MPSMPRSSRPTAALLGIACALGLLFAVAGAARAASPGPSEQTPILFPTATPTPTGPATADSTAREPAATPEETAAPRPTATLRATATRRSAAEATVLVERLRLRTGPETGYPIVTRAFTGDVLRVTGQSGECSWLRVLTADGVAGWVSAETGLLTLNAECASIPISTALVRLPTETPLPTRTPTATPSPTPSKSPVPPLALRPFLGPPRTPTPRPLVTPSPTSSAVALPVPTPNRLAAIAAGGPTAVGSLFPEPNWVGRIRLPFSWVADAPLTEGQLFELAFWLPGQTPQEGIGWTYATTESTLAVNLYDQTPGDYLWGIWLGGMVDGSYQRIRYLGGGNTLRIVPEEEPDQGAPPPSNCSPEAPCRP